jgi:chaperone required for assembly of F1-ATPase
VKAYLWRMGDDFTADWFPSQEGPADPIRAAQKAMRPALPRRFYRQASVEPQDGAFVLTLDGKPARTPARHPLALPNLALGEAVAAEWREQGEEIDPAAMPLTRLANSAIDGVRPNMAGVRDDLVRYASSDLVCYRVGEPDRLAGEQARAWDPLLAWAHEALGARFVLSEGLMFVGQPEAALDAVRAALVRLTSPFALAALHVMTTLTGSVLIALAHAAGRLTAEEAWAAAHTDERFQESIWGEDEEALKRRAARKADFMAASRLYGLAAAPTSR